MIPSAISITQATEAGTVYRQNEIAALSEIAHERSLAVHMDGARFANALVALETTPAEMTWKRGVDIVLLPSLGAAAEKNDKHLAVPTEINPIAGAAIDFQFGSAFRST